MFSEHSACVEDGNVVKYTGTFQLIVTRVATKVRFNISTHELPLTVNVTRNIKLRSWPFSLIRYIPFIASDGDHGN